MKSGLDFGYAYVEFAEEAMARAAMLSLDGKPNAALGSSYVMARIDRRMEHDGMGSYARRGFPRGPRGPGGDDDARADRGFGDGGDHREGRWRGAGYREGGNRGRFGLRSDGFRGDGGFRGFRDRGADGFRGRDDPSAMSHRSGGAYDAATFDGAVSGGAGGFRAPRMARRRSFEQSMDPELEPEHERELEHELQQDRAAAEGEQQEGHPADAHADKSAGSGKI